MRDEHKTKEQLIDELREMRHKVSAMEAIEARLLGTAKALQESEERYRAVVDNVEIGISLLNANLEIVEVNKAMKRYFPQVQPGCGQVCYEQYNDPPGKNPCSYCPCVLTLQDGEVHKAITETPAGGEIRHYHLISSPIKDSVGQVQYVIELVEDITERKQVEQALQDSEKRLRLTLEATQIGIWDWDVKNDRWYATPTYYTMLGYQPKTGMADRREWLDRVHPDDRARVHEKIQNVFTRDFKEYQYEARLRHANGTYRWQHVRGFGIKRDEDGKVTRMLGIRMDINERKRAEEALQESEEQYRAVFRSAGIGIRMVNKDRRITRANPALLKMLGYGEEELLELTSADITHPDDREMTARYLETILGNGSDTLRLEKRYIRKDGSAIWGDVSISALRDAQGNRTAALEVIADITDRTRSQVALQDSEERMRRIIDSSPVGIRITQNGKHVYANRALAKIFGYETQEEILGLPAEALFTPESRSLIRQRMADRMVGKTIPAHYEVSGLTRQGKTISLESWGTEIDYLGKRSWLAFIIDVSEAKSLRAQLLQAQKMEAVGTLAGGIAHDFNNILQVVLGFSEILLMGKAEGDEEHEDIRKILSAARKGADLVRGLLAFSRRAGINPKPLNLNLVIHQAESILARTIPKTIQIELMLQERLPAVSADPFQIEQILLNLAINARDAMPEGGTLTFVTSKVSLDETFSREHLETSPGDYVLLTVSDTGEGMTKQTLEHIFEPFFSTKAAGEGTGLGLAMVHGIVRQHGGLIRCYSEPGHGTTFKIYFPALISEEEKEETTVREMPRGGSETILLVDDEELIRDLGSKILTKAGYQVIMASTGEEALETYQARGTAIALVLLDLIMPQMGGKPCLEGLLRINPAVNVVIASGYSANHPTRDALAAGARGFVNKPYDVRQVLEVIRSVLDGEQRETKIPD